MAEMRWKVRPPGSNWGEFGKDDQLGRLNFLTNEKRQQGLRFATEGIAFCLSLPLDYPGGSGLNPRRKPPILRPTLRSNSPNFNAELGGDLTDVVCDDLVVMHLQYSTQWDALSHVGSLFDANDDGKPEKVYYNGFKAGQDIIGPSSIEDAGVGSTASSCAQKLGIEVMAATGVQGCGVMIDLHAHFGNRHTIVGYSDLMRVIEKDGVSIEKGDMVCLHTGFAQLVYSMNKQPDHDTLHNSCSVLDGRDTQLLNWISDSGLAVLIADNYAVEAFPAKASEECCAALPLHEHCLFKNGIHLGELWYLSPLAKWLREHQRNRFLLTAPPLRLPGAVGSPVTPVATV